MKKIRFSIIQQVILTVLLIAFFPVFEGFCIFSTFQRIDSLSNSIVASRVVSTLLKNPFKDSRKKETEELCMYYARFFSNVVSFVSPEDLDVFDKLIYNAFNKNSNYRNIRVRVIGLDKKVIADNALLLENDAFFYEQDEKINLF